MRAAFLLALLPAVLPSAPAAEPAPELQAYPPARAAATMQVPEGFEVTLCAAEPDLVQPVAMCLDDRGRVWVAEGHSYPKHHDDPQHDRILIFEDTDGDGRFDRRTVFFDRLNYVTGLEVGFGGAWVMSPPYFFFIPDRDRDDVPDAAPTVVLDGFGNHANSHNLANGFAWGPDGWLYGTHGRTNWSMIGRPGDPDGKRARFDGGVWRYHPVRDTWEPYADGCTNPWGIDWNDHGQAFIPNTVDPHLFHAIQGAHYEPWRNRASSRFAYQRIATIADHLHFTGKRNVRDGLGTEAELAAGGGHSHCGILVYLGDNWPDRYRNTVFLHNTHGKRINNDVLERKGSGYTAHHGPDFLITPDPWFMGVSFRTAPDGSVYITDWSDTGECHSTRNTRRGTGRLYRISYGKPAFRKVNLAALSNAELVDLQLHKNDWFVRHARRLLHERAADGQDLSPVHASLRAMLAKHPDVTRRLRALWALWVTGGADPALLSSLLADENEHLRAWAVTLLCEPSTPSPAVLAKFADLAASGSSSLVRLSLASALQRLGPAQRWTLAESLLGRAEDRDDQNLPLMIWYGIEPLVHENVARFAALGTGAQLPLVRRHVARRIASLPNPGAGLDAVLAHLARSPDAETIDGLLTGLNGRENISAPPNWSRAADAIAKVPSLARPLAALRSRFGDPHAFAALRATAEDEIAPARDRIEALTRLLEAPDPALAPWVLDQLDDPVLQRTALRGLARFEKPTIASRILDHYPSLRDPGARRDALQTLAARPSTAAALLDAVEAARIPRADLSSYTIRQIYNLGNPTLNKRLAATWGDLRATPKAKRKRIDQLRRALPDALPHADRSHGRRLFQERCAACHKLFGAGGDLGPELTGAQRTNLDYLLENIVDPGASVAREFQMQVIELTDGRTLTGFVSAETETTVTIRTINDEFTTARSAIRTRTISPLSIMPEGLLADLTQAQLADLFAYLTSPAQVALP